MLQSKAGKKRSKKVSESLGRVFPLKHEFLAKINKTTNNMFMFQYTPITQPQH